MQLMWAFYAYSKPFAIIVGVIEILGSVLFIIPKTRIFGGLVLTSILVNVILQDYFYGVLLGALLYAIIFQIFILIVFYFHREKIRSAFHQISIKSTFFSSLKSFKNILIFVGITLSLFIIIYFLILFTAKLLQ